MTEKAFYLSQSVFFLQLLQIIFPAESLIKSRNFRQQKKNFIFFLRNQRTYRRLLSLPASNPTKRTNHQKTMTAITEIKIHWAESFLIKEGATFASLAEANQVLEKLAKARKDTGGYTKVAYTATFEDGAQYDGRFDVQAIDAPQETSNGALCFLQAMRDFISFKAGMRKPEWMTAEQYSTSVDRSPEVLEWVARVGLAAA